LQGKTLNVQITHAINASKVSAKAKTLADHMVGKPGEIGLFIGPENLGNRYYNTHHWNLCQQSLYLKPWLPTRTTKECLKK